LFGLYFFEDYFEYDNASTGFIFDAFIAGKVPNNVPNKKENNRDKKISEKDI